MLILLIMNYVFDVTVKKYKKMHINCYNHKEKFKKLLAVFDDEKIIFKIDNVCLLIEDTSIINAYAVGGFRENCIILTTGIMELCRKHSNNEIEYYRLLSCVIGHELSHIINKDFFPSLLITINEKVNKVMSFIIFIVLNILSKIASFIPVIGPIFSNLFIRMYSFVKYLMGFFYNFIFIPVYHFIQLQISKSIEYRADEQGAKYCGGCAMSKALSLLGKNGFFSIFSTHPRTICRIKKVRLVKQCNDYIEPVCFANVSIIFSFLMLLYFIMISYRSLNFTDFYLLCDLLSSLIRKVKLMYNMYVGWLIN